MIKLHFIINMFAILWKIWFMNFFYTFFISFLFIIFIRILCSLQSNDKSFLNHCFLVDASSFAMLIHDVISNMKHVFSYICNCLLKSWMNVFNFYMFFAINASWFLIFLSKTFQRCLISFKVIFFHEWSLLFFFFNINIYVNKFMMLLTFISSLHKYLSLASLSLCDKSMLLTVIIESALLLFMQFIIIYSSIWFLLFHL